MSIRSFAALPFLLALVASDRARAQSSCGTWSNGFWDNGIDFGVHSLAVYDDGNGPSLYAGGDFSWGGGVTLIGIGRWNGSNWYPLGSGMSGANPPVVRALTVFDDGGGPALYAGGTFLFAGGVPARCIARWDGSAWSPLDVGTSSDVYALTVFDDGTGPALYAGGIFGSAGGTAAPGIAKWNGSSWSAVGSGLPAVHALCVHDDGSGSKLYAGCTTGVLRWDGTSWTSFGGTVNGEVDALTSFDAGSGVALYVGGSFSLAGGVSAVDIAKWDGSAWSAVGAGMSGFSQHRVNVIAGFDDGTGPALYAGGDFSQAGLVQALSIARWDGTAWFAVDFGLWANDPFDPDVLALATFDDLTEGGPHLYAGGDFLRAGPPPAFGAANITKLQGCANPGLSLCFGDGSGAACPCGNSGAQHRGCLNSVTTEGASLSATGRTNPDTILLQAFGEKPSALSIFLQGTITISPAVFGDGLRCTGGQLLRLYVKTADRGAVSAPGPGDLSITARAAALGSPIPPGHRRYYQVYYRDAASGFCAPPAGGTFNVTNGVRLIW